MNHKVEKIGKAVFGGVFLIILTYLFMGAVIGTSNMNKDEMTYFCKDNIWVQGGAILLMIVAVFVLLMISEKITSIKAKKICSKIVEIGSTVFITALGVYLVLATQMEPINDQRVLLNAVEHIRAGSFVDFEPGSI